MHALLHFVVGNLLVAVPVGLVAFFVQRGQRFLAVAHVLWLLCSGVLLGFPSKSSGHNGKDCSDTSKPNCSVYDSKEYRSPGSRLECCQKAEHAECGNR